MYFSEIYMSLRRRYENARLIKQKSVVEKLITFIYVDKCCDLFSFIHSFYFVVLWTCHLWLWNQRVLLNFDYLIIIFSPYMSKNLQIHIKYIHAINPMSHLLNVANNPIIINKESLRSIAKSSVIEINIFIHLLQNLVSSTTLLHISININKQCTSQ